MTKLIKKPDVGFPLGDVFDAAVFQASFNFTYLSGVTQETAFSVPANTQIIALGFKITTLFDAVVSFTLSDTDGPLFKLDDVFTLSAGNNGRFQFVGKVSNGNIVLDQVEPLGSLGAGAGKIIVLYSIGGNARALTD